MWKSNKLSVLLRVSCFMQSSGIQFYFFKPKKKQIKNICYIKIQNILY